MTRREPHGPDMGHAPTALATDTTVAPLLKPDSALFAAAAAAIALGGIVTAARAVAEPRCGFQGDWDCTGQPQYNGPLQSTWSHGLTTMPQICPGGASMQPCQFYVPQP